MDILITVDHALTHNCALPIVKGGAGPIICKSCVMLDGKFDVSRIAQAFDEMRDGMIEQIRRFEETYPGLKVPKDVSAVRIGSVMQCLTQSELDATKTVDSDHFNAQEHPGSLTFSALRRANTARLPLFKNCHGEPAHSKEDGSDWTPAQWLQALVGELGEYAEVRVLYEEGKISFEEFQEKASKELADVQTYLDLLSRRVLDTVIDDRSPNLRMPNVMQNLVAVLGSVANSRKKYERGDYCSDEYELATDSKLIELGILTSDLLSVANVRLNAPTIDAHPIGVDLGEATRAKFNEVSERVGCNVFV